MEPEVPDHPNRALVLAGAVAGALATLGLALTLGAWAFQYRSVSLHEGRLERLRDRKPTANQVSQALAAEGARLIETRSSSAALTSIEPQWPAALREAVQAKHTRWAETRVYGLADMVYIVYFDTDGVMRDFVCAAK